MKIREKESLAQCSRVIRECKRLYTLSEPSWFLFHNQMVVMWTDRVVHLPVHVMRTCYRIILFQQHTLTVNIYVCPCVCVSTRLLVCLSIYLSISSACPFLRSSVSLFIYSSVCLSRCLSTCLSTCFTKNVNDWLFFSNLLIKISDKCFKEWQKVSFQSAAQNAVSTIKVHRTKQEFGIWHWKRSDE